MNNIYAEMNSQYHVKHSWLVTVW